MLSVPCFLSAVMIVYIMTICCSYEKRDDCVKLVSFCNYLLLFGFCVPFCLLCFVYALVESGRECACTEYVNDYYPYLEQYIDNPLSLGPCTQQDHGLLDGRLRENHCEPCFMDWCAKPCRFSRHLPLCLCQELQQDQKHRHDQESQATHGQERDLTRSIRLE